MMISHVTSSERFPSFNGGVEAYADELNSGVRTLGHFLALGFLFSASNALVTMDEAQKLRLVTICFGWTVFYYIHTYSSPRHSVTPGCT